MRREPSLTLQGALAVLGHHEPRLIGKLDRLLGGVILAAGAGAGLAAVGVPALAPLAALGAVWGWLEQKNEAVRLLRQALDAVSGKLMGTRGYERRQLIAAAHTTIVIAAFFESFREQVGNDLFERLQISDAEKKMLAAGRWPRSGESFVELLYSAEIPAPSPTRGYEDNIAAIEEWANHCGAVFQDFLRGLTVTEGLDIEWNPITVGAIERYQSHYLALAATVPEFMVWAMLGEHAATRSGIADLRSDLAAALDVNRGALGRVEALLALQAAGPNGQMDLCSVMERANRSVLDQPIVPMDAESYGTAVVFPTVGRIYVNPRYRIARADTQARPADETWWEKLPSNADIDLMFAAYVMAPDATRLPLLLLGHPGAGKSLLTKVIAARLPASVYTVVRVPLRQVAANAPIVDQIQQALDLATHKRVEWWRLVEQSPGTVRVVLLDGLDELLQATSNDRSGYLQEVMEFQRLETDQERPVVVIVTSRTVVADRVNVPAGTTIVKLDYFNELDIEAWLDRWRMANASSIASGAVRELTVAAAHRQYELARQPLLLLMLALYSADPAFPALDADLSTADLYQRLLDNFARREVGKRAQGQLPSDEMDRRVHDQLERLSVAALAMFNRGRQDITEADLGADLIALGGNSSEQSHPVELGQRLIGEFFFVHAAEARPLSVAGPTDDASTTVAPHRGLTHRAYEFLHATFGEYLVASRVMNELVDVAETAFAGRRGPREPEDDLLFALLSHQPLTVRHSTLEFAGEMFANLTETECNHLQDMLEVLIGSYHRRHASDRYATYRPLPLDRVRQLAAYSANLVMLRAALEPDHAPVPLARMFRESSDTMLQWRSTVTLWRAGLDADGLQAMASSLVVSENSVRFGRNDISLDRLSTSYQDLMFARLLGDAKLEDRLRFGIAICDRSCYFDINGSDWAKGMLSWLIPDIAGTELFGVVPMTPPNAAEASINMVATLLMRLMKSRDLDAGPSNLLVKTLLGLPRVFDFDEQALASIVLKHPELLNEFRDLKDPKIYGKAYLLLRLMGMGEELSMPATTSELDEVLLAWWNTHYPDEDPLQEKIRTLIRDLLDVYVGRAPFQTFYFDTDPERH